MRRDQTSNHPAVAVLVESLRHRIPVYTTGLILQELLQGFHGPKDRQAILERFDALPMIEPQREDYIAAADIRNVCRREGVQIRTVDALIARLCITHDFTLLTADQDFTHLARYAPLKLWPGPTQHTLP